MTQFQVTNINDLELLYSVLRETYPKNQIEIIFNWNTKIYNINVTDRAYQEDPDVPVDINIEVVYGDSVTCDTPVILRDPKTKQIYIKTIDDITQQWQEYPEFKMFDQTIRLEKQYGLTHYEVWCDKGWNPIKKVIRHKTNKKIYRVLTHTGVVDVTEDHSLIRSNYEKVKPKDLLVGDDLLHSFPSDFNSNINTISNDRAYIYGFFYGDGSCGKYESKSGLKYSWALNNSNLDVLNYLKNLLQKEYPNHKPVIYDTIKSSGVYKLSINDQKEFIEEYRAKFYDSNKYKKIPVEILNSSLDIVQRFFDGYWAADGCRKDKELIGCTRFDNKGKIGSAGLYYLMKRLGYKISLNTRYDKPDILRLTVTKNEQRKMFNKIKKIIECPDVTTEQFVYDLETEKGIFGCGVGEIQLNNTDSCFLSFKFNRKDFEKNRKDTFRLATLCGDKLTDDIFNRKPIELEFEKVFHPFILLTKKRYIANKYENPKDPFELKGVDAKGIALTRRDYCPMVKKCYKEIINAIVNDDSVNGRSNSDPMDSVKRSINLYKGYLKNIMEYKINVDDLVVSAMLAASYKTKPVHVQLAERLKQRKEEVQIGDRIPYIYIESDDPKRAKSELGEDPQYAIKHNLKYNRSCYLEQLAKPILGFYKIVLKDHVNLLDDIIDHTNDCLVKCGGKRLKPSDFKLDE